MQVLIRGLKTQCAELSLRLGTQWDPFFSSWQQWGSEAEMRNKVPKVPITSMPMCPVPQRSQRVRRSRLNSLKESELQACAGASSLTIFIHSQHAWSGCDRGVCAMIGTEHNIEMCFFTDFFVTLLVGLVAFE